MKVTQQTQSRPNTGCKRYLARVCRQKYLLLMLLPAFVVTLLFSYIPLSGWYVAFSEYRLSTGIFGGEFVGLKYIRQFIDELPNNWYLIRNTLVINLGTLALGMLCPITLAILLKEMRWKTGAKIVQTITFFPYFISYVIAYSIATALFATNTGVINQFLVSHGILEKGLNLLGDAKYSWWFLILLNVWLTLGYDTIIFMSSISGIPQEQYEAAALDGAGRFSSIWYVTLPNLLPTVSVLLIMNAGWVLNSSLDEYLLFSNATNLSQTNVLDLYIYKLGLGQLNFPFATAATIVKSLIGIGLVTLVNWIAKKMRQSSAI